MGKRLYFNHEARRLLQDGVDALANAVREAARPPAPPPAAGGVRSRGHLRVIPDIS